MLNKNEKITKLILYLQEKYGLNNILIKDHWEDSEDAIGLTDRSGEHLIYVSIFDNSNLFYASLENPPIDNSLPYSGGGDFDNLTLEEVEIIITSHLRVLK